MREDVCSADIDEVQQDEVVLCFCCGGVVATGCQGAFAHAAIVRRDDGVFLGEDGADMYSGG